MAKTHDRWAVRGARLAGYALALCACGEQAGGPAGGTIDAQDAPIDAAPPPPPMPAPRLIAPLSMTAVTQQRPVLRWEMPDGVTDPVIELCKDRQCATPLPIVADLALDGRSAAPRAALPSGFVFWRVRGTSSGQAVSSATWQFWVGRSSATSLVDTGNGAILDVNGDGYADFLVGAPSTASASGVVYLYLGSATAGAGGWNGAAPAARIALFGNGSLGGFGSVLASAGDVNGDGYADFLISTPSTAPGKVQLYFGSASPSAAGWTADGARGRLELTNPVPGGFGFGISVAGAGDIDGDGFGDFVITGGTGTHIYFGSASPSASDWGAGASRRRIELSSPTLGDGFGIAAAGVGDVDGDGYADLLVGASAPSFDPGRAYLYLGSPAPSGTAWNKPSSTSRIELITPDGFDRWFARTLARAGDVNGDGYADFLIGAELAGDVTDEIGAAHLYFGSAAPSAAGWNGAGASQRTDLVSPDDAMGTFGSAVASAGDVNGDGFADFVITSSHVGGGRGAAHVYLGGLTVDLPAWNGVLAHAARIDLLNPDGENAHFGGCAGSAGDVNGDGFSDFLIGTFSDAFTSSAAGGAAHLYLGQASADVASWNGTAPMRIDVANPGGRDTAFGNAVAFATKRARALGRLR